MKGYLIVHEPDADFLSNRFSLHAIFISSQSGPTFCSALVWKVLSCLHVLLT